MDVEMQEVRDFLAQHAPFDALPAGVLDGVPRRCRLRYARRGTVVLDAGEVGAGLYVVRSGSVDVMDETGALVERVGPGGAFGMSSLLERRPARYRCTATEDTLLIVLDREVFDDLAEQHSAFRSFYAATHHDRLSTAVANLREATSGRTVLGARVRDLVARALVTTAPGASVAEAAATMSRAGVSSVLVVEGGAIVGIVTDRDLRNRVLAAGRGAESPIRDVMTSPAVTLRADAPVFEALLEMVSRGIHHLPLVDGREAVGMVSTTDLVRLQSSNPVYLAADIARQDAVDAVVELAGRIPSVLADLVDRDVTADDVTRVVTALGDAVRRRVVALVEAELGAPPVPYSWVALGSVAREEEALSADQDHAMAIAAPGHDEWFARLADRVTDALEAAGWPRCPGDVMATNPRWRLTVEDWRRRLASWSREPDPEAVLNVAIAYDMRHLAGDHLLTAAVRRAAAGSVSQQLLGHLGGQAVRARPPLGFFRGFVLEHGGRHRQTLDIKRGIGAAVQLARVHALRAGSMALTTRSRIDAARDAGLLDAASAADLQDAFELMSHWRLRHQVAQWRSGAIPDNHLPPADLTGHQRRHLKDAFAVVTSAQQRFAQTLAPGFT
jgi:CBS domain-containing protein